MEPTPRPSIAPLVIITLAVLLIVAMICGTVIWVMQRTMSLNEKFLDARLAEAARPAPQTQPVQVTPPAQPAQPAPKPQPKPAAKAQPKPAPKAKPAPAPAAKPAPEAKPTPAATAKPAEAAKPAPKPTLPPKTKREAPKELPAAKDRLGPDGTPRDRISLPIGNDELEWQL
ncbi:MAG: hypothetical protein ACI4RT_07615 [Candidatus Spyradenecus sp.]